MTRFTPFESMPFSEASTDRLGLHGLVRRLARRVRRYAHRPRRFASWLLRSLLRLARFLAAPAKTVLVFFVKAVAAGAKKVASLAKAAVRSLRFKEVAPPESHADRAIWDLIQQLALRQGGQPARVTAFIAARPDEGASDVAREYASALASETRRKVLLIDANPFAPRPFHAYGSGISVETLGALTPPPFNEPVHNESIHAAAPDAAVNDPSHPADAGAGGEPGHGARDSRPHGAGELMRHAHSWERLLESFDSLVIDVPPLQSSFNGVVLAAKADAVVLVVAAETTPRAVVRRLRDTLVSANARIAGIVMNRRRYYIPERVYKRL